MWQGECVAVLRWIRHARLCRLLPYVSLLLPWLDIACAGVYALLNLPYVVRCQFTHGACITRAPARLCTTYVRTYSAACAVTPSRLLRWGFQLFFVIAGLLPLHPLIAVPDIGPLGQYVKRKVRQHACGAPLMRSTCV